MQSGPESILSIVVALDSSVSDNRLFGNMAAGSKTKNAGKPAGKAGDRNRSSAKAAN
jgi:hypothetical protein